MATVVALSVSAGAQPADETGFEADAELKHVSIWTSPVPTPDNAFAAAFMSAFQFSSYCQPVSLRPQFRTEITRYEAEFPGDVSLNVLAAATPPDATIELSLTAASGDALPMVTANGVSVADVNGESVEIPNVWSLPRQIGGGGFNVYGLQVGGNTLEIRVSGAGGDASRSWVFQLNRLAPDPNAEGDPECPDPAVDALMDAVSQMESGVAH